MDVYKAHSMLMDLAAAAGFKFGDKFSAEDIAQRLSGRKGKVETALREFLDITTPATFLKPPDPAYGAEVKALGDRIGYGAMMASAQASWRELLKRDGLEGGEHTHGPCYAVLMDARAKAEDALKEI